MDAYERLLGEFKAAAGEGALVELKLRFLAGKLPGLQTYAHQSQLGDIEAELVKHFSDFISAEEKETLRLCRQLRNKVLHSDFHAARHKLNELGLPTHPGKHVVVLNMADGSHKSVADTLSTGEGGVFAWFLEAGSAGDFQKAADAFKQAQTIVDRLAWIEKPSSA